MSSQPIIIQVLSGDDRRIIHRWMVALGLLTATLLTLAIVAALQYGQDVQSVLITGVMVLILIGNLILLFRNNMIDRLSKSLCLDGGRCYTVSKNGITHDWSPVRLLHKREMLTIKSDKEKALNPKKIFAFQVLDHRDWEALQGLNTGQAGVSESQLVSILPAALPKDHAL